MSEAQERDAQADLAIVNAATPEPWFVDHFTDGGLEGYYVGSGTRFDNVCVCHYQSEGEKFSEEEEPESIAADFAFIAMARDALPYWIERARQLEAERDHLRAENESLREGQGNG